MEDPLYPQFTCASTSERPRPIRGWLKKQGAKSLIKSWERRYFLQRESQVHYFTSELTTNTPRGHIDLLEVVDVRPYGFARNVPLTTTASHYKTGTWFEVSVLALSDVTQNASELFTSRTYLLDCAFTAQSSTAPREMRTTDLPLVLEWVDLFHRWLRYYDALEVKRIQRLKHEQHTAGIRRTEPVVVKPAVPELSTEQRLEQAERALREREGVVDELRSRIDKLRTELQVQEKVQHIRLQDKIKSLQTLVDEQQREIGGMLEGLKKSDHVLSEHECKCDTLRVKVSQKHEQVDLNRHRLHALKSNVASCEQSVVVQEQNIQRLKQELEQELNSAHQTKLQGDNSWESEISALQEQLERQKQKNRVHQIKNETLSKQLLDTEEEHSAKMKLRNQTLSALEGETAVIDRQYADMAHKLLEEQQLDATHLQQIEELTKKYFFSLALGIKLQQQYSGKDATAFDLVELYERALIDKIPRAQFGEWLTSVARHRM
eukprot:TRINITY_DN4245_c0_g1_i1.p1 TRINITY_DN4245_c0_g1~~TRINITY_DN4245_c0_g1_i1.p1  ORF type:complete len:559 (-),score=230.32 TRINITY_DN4245_c0_g1_i1:83-1555(-)